MRYSVGRHLATWASFFVTNVVATVDFRCGRVELRQDFSAVRNVSRSGLSGVSPEETLSRLGGGKEKPESGVPMVIWIDPVGATLSFHGPAGG